MINIITGDSTIVPIDDAKEFGIPSIHKWIICPENGMNPNNFEEYVKDICEQSNEKDFWIFTYSAMIIEFFEVLSQYYEVECHFYLNDDIGCLPYKNDHMSDIYNYLAKPYRKVNRYRIKVNLGETINSKKECCCNGKC